MKENAPVEQYDWSMARRDVQYALLLRQARQQFFDRLAKRAPRPEKLEPLLGEREPLKEGFQRDHLCILAEFLFSLRALGLDDPQVMLKYIEVHNTEIEQEVATSPLCRDPSAVDGLTPYGSRLKKSKFSEREKDLVRENYFDNDDRFCLSYSDVSRLMCRLMSAGPVDGLLTALTQAGLLAKTTGQRGAILVYSPDPGVLEEEFGRYLRSMRAASTETGG